MSNKPKVSHRMAELKFPTDEYGFTHRLKKEALAAIYRVRGHADKKRILDETIALLVAFSEAKFAYDTANRNAQDETPAAPEVTPEETDKPEDDPTAGLFDD